MVFTRALLSPHNKVIGIAGNYIGNLAYNKDRKEPIVFFKGGDSDNIQITEPNKKNKWIGTSSTRLPKLVGTEQFWNEPELALIVFSTNSFYITLANDVTRKVQYIDDCHGMQSKTWKHSCILHHYSIKLPTQFIFDLESFDDDYVERVGYDNTMVFKIKQIIDIVSKYIKLYPGDVILTGAPKLINAALEIENKTITNQLTIYHHDETIMFTMTNHFTSSRR